MAVVQRIIPHLEQRTGPAMVFGLSEGDDPPPPGKSRRKLLIYTHALAGGGAERVCAILASGFAEQGWEVLLAVDAQDEANRGYLTAGVRVHVLGQGHLRAVLRLARLLADEKPDVSLSAIGVSNVKHAAAAALGGRLAHAILSYHAFAVSEPQWLSRSAYWLSAILSRVTARTVAVSNGLRCDLIRRWRASARRTVAIYNPVLVGQETSSLRRSAGEPPLVLAAGRLVEGKNMRGLIRAFHRIADRCDADLVILGEGPARPSLEAEIAALDLKRRVHLAGYAAKPWDFYRRAACFATASPIESFSMVVAEALIYGLPVVAYDSAGPREVLDDGRYGTLVPPGDEAAIGEALLEKLASPGDDACRRARGERFSLDAGLKAYNRLFHDVIAEAAEREGRSFAASAKRVGWRLFRGPLVD